MFALDSLSMAVTRWFAETTLVASALALVAYVVARWRGPSPAIRHILWLVVLLKLMMPPVVHWPWSRPLLAPLSAPRPIAVAATIEGSTRGVGTSGRASTTPLDGPRVPRMGGPTAGIAGRFDDPEDGDPGRAWPVAWFVAAWLIGSIALVVEQLARIFRFRSQVRGATPAPAWLVAEAEEIGRRMSVRVPTIRVVERLATPLLWCLGRPVLLVPAGLLGSLEPGRWRGILAHELAHLRRGDPWVGRLELIALVIWWWNPLYWLARRRIDFEAELACDSWVLWAFPEDRIEYAESLVQICAIPRSAGSPAPALGVSGAGRSFERRLIMVLRGQASQDAPLPALLAATLLAALALPSWTLGAIEEARPIPIPTPLVSVTTSARGLIAADDDDDDDDDDDSKPSKKAKADKAKADKAKADRKSALLDDSLDREDLQKKLQALGEKMGKEIEEKFGPEFEKKMEALGKEIEEKFGPEFEKKMEALGKEVEKQFGPGSDFAQQMKQLGEQLAKEFGPGSDFEQKVKVEVKIKSDEDQVKSDEDKKKIEKTKSDELKEKSDEDKAKADKDKDKKKADEAKAKARAGELKARAEMAKARAEEAKARASARAKIVRDKAEAEPAAKAKPKPEVDRKTRRIEALESRIEAMMKELKQLKAEGKDQDNDEDKDEV